MRAGVRWTELRLLLAPCVFVVGGLALLLALQNQPLNVLTVSPALIFIAFVLAVHAGLDATGTRGDQVILPLGVALSAIGLVVVNRVASADLALRQAIWMLIGLGLFGATLYVLRDPPNLRRYKYTWALLAILLLGITLVFGKDVNGSGQRLWIDLRVLLFQPTELVKICFVFFLAAYLEQYREMLTHGELRLGPVRLPPIPYLLPLGIMWGITLLMLFVQRDLGSALLFFGIFILMLYVASARPVYLLVGLVAFLLAAVIAYRFTDTVQVRIDAWLDPWSDASGRGYQIVQALMAFGSGGVLGSGLTFGTPNYIPAVHTDFVLAAIGEEMGLLGSLAVVAIYILLFHRGFKIALAARNPFNQLLAAGLTSVVALQTLIIMGGVLKVLPLTGVTMPFISYGGSSLLANFVILAILMRISAAESAA